MRLNKDAGADIIVQSFCMATLLCLIVAKAGEKHMHCHLYALIFCFRLNHTICISSCCFFTLKLPVFAIFSLINGQSWQIPYSAGVQEMADLKWFALFYGV